MLKGTASTHPEQHLAVGPLVVRLIALGWSLDQIVFGKREYLVPKSPSEVSKREKGRQLKASLSTLPVDIAVFDDPKHVGDYRHLVFFIETKQPEETSGLEQLARIIHERPGGRLASVA